MRWHRTAAFALGLAGILVSASAMAQDPANQPAPAVNSVQDEVNSFVLEFQKSRDAIRAKAEDDLRAAQDKLLDQFKQLQEKYTKEGKLDEALFVRNQIRIVSTGYLVALPDPGNLEAYKERVGDVYFFRVTGATGGEVFGSEIYTTDSHLATAAVHAGVLKFGETKVVMVTILPAKNSFQGSDRLGISSMDWGSWPASFKVEPVPNQGTAPPLNTAPAQQQPSEQDLRN